MRWIHRPFSSKLSFRRVRRGKNQSLKFVNLLKFKEAEKPYGPKSISKSSKDAMESQFQDDTLMIGKICISNTNLIIA